MTIARVATCLLAIAAAAAPARAQSAEADVLFREGKKLLKDGHIAEACEKLDASERLESSVGTLLNLADCHEKNGRLATAWATFRKATVAARKARDGKREQEARRREKLLTPRLSYLSVNVPDTNLVAGLAITRNGVEFDRALWNQRLPIDAGDYDLVAAADGYVEWTDHLRIDREGQKAEIDVPLLSARPRPAPATHPASGPDAAREPSRVGPAVHHDPPRPSRLTAMRGVAIGLATAGAAGIAVGAIYGVRGRRLEQQSDALCPTSTCNDTHALALNADARHHGRTANIAFGVGGGLFATAIVLWLVGGPHVAPVVAHDRVGFALVGGF
jgi:hypothetical protein